MSRRHVHIRITDYEHELPQIAAVRDVSENLAALPADKVRGEHVVPIDCPDCGRTLAFRGCCRKCGGRSWMPAGHVDRFALRRMVNQQEESK